MAYLDPAEVEFDYDAEEDILYVALRGRLGDAAVTYETDEGHLVRLDPATHEFIGAEILAYRARWEGRDLNFEWDLVQRDWLWRKKPQHRQVSVHEARAVLA